VSNIHIELIAYEVKKIIKLEQIYSNILSI